MSINTTVSNIVGKVFDNSLVGGLVLGKSATYTTQSQGTYNPLTGGINNSTADSSVNVIEQEYSSREIADSNGAITNADRRFLMVPISGIKAHEVINDSLTVDNRKYQIMAVTKKSMGDTNLVWELQCR